MDRLEAMKVFAAVVDGGSQTAAAQRLDLSRPVVSRYLAELEAWAGTRLLHRTTRRFSLTPAGNEVLAKCRQMLELAHDIPVAGATSGNAPQGLLRITVSTSFGQAQLVGAVHEFVALNPGVAVDLMLLDRAVNLVDERIDLAIRITNDLDPNLIARRLTVCRSVVCASPAYLRAHPLRRVEDLAQHNCLTHSYYGKTLWDFEGRRRAGVGCGQRQHQRERFDRARDGGTQRRRRGDAADLRGRAADTRRRARRAAAARTAARTEHPCGLHLAQAHVFGAEGDPRLPGRALPGRAAVGPRAGSRVLARPEVRPEVIAELRQHALENDACGLTARPANLDTG